MQAKQDFDETTRRMTILMRLSRIATRYGVKGGTGLWHWYVKQFQDPEKGLKNDGPANDTGELEGFYDEKAMLRVTEKLEQEGILCSVQEVDQPEKGLKNDGPANDTGELEGFYDEKAMLRVTEKLEQEGILCSVQEVDQNGTVKEGAAPHFIQQHQRKLIRKLQKLDDRARRNPKKHPVYVDRAMKNGTVKEGAAPHFIQQHQRKLIRKLQKLDDRARRNPKKHPVYVDRAMKLNLRAKIQANRMQQAADLTDGIPVVGKLLQDSADRKRSRCDPDPDTRYVIRTNSSKTARAEQIALKTMETEPLLKQDLGFYQPSEIVHISSAEKKILEEQEITAAFMKEHPELPYGSEKRLNMDNMITYQMDIDRLHEGTSGAALWIGEAAQYGQHDHLSDGHRPVPASSGHADGIQDPAHCQCHRQSGGTDGAPEGQAAGGGADPCQWRSRTWDQRDEMAKQGPEQTGTCDDHRADGSVHDPGQDTHQRHLRTTERKPNRIHGPVRWEWRLQGAFLRFQNLIKGLRYHVGRTSKKNGIVAWIQQRKGAVSSDGQPAEQKPGKARKLRGLGS